MTDFSLPAGDSNSVVHAGVVALPHLVALVHPRRVRHIHFRHSKAPEPEKGNLAAVGVLS